MRSIRGNLTCIYHTSAMCGRYTLTADLKKVADRFGAPDERPRSTPAATTASAGSTHPCPSEEGNMLAYR